MNQLEFMQSLKAKMVERKQPLLVLTHGNMESLAINKFVKFIAASERVIIPITRTTCDLDSVCLSDIETIPIFLLSGDTPTWVSQFWHTLTEYADIIIHINGTGRHYVQKDLGHERSAACPDSLAEEIELCIQNCIR